MSNSHALEEVLEQYVLGTLSVDQTDALEDHLLVCEDCRLRFEETERFVGTLRKAMVRLEQRRAAGTQSTRRRFSFHPGPAWAIAAVCAQSFLMIVVPRYAGPPAVSEEVTLNALRGEAPETGSAHSNRNLILHLDAAGLERHTHLQIEIVTDSGQRRWSSKLSYRPELTVRLNTALPAGQYFVRLFDAPEQNELLREYSLRVQ